jgi:hypothetical protein
MTKDEMKRLRNEVLELRKTVKGLKEVVEDLTTKVHGHEQVSSNEMPTAQYKIFGDHVRFIQRDASWDRLIGLLEDSSSGLTATELASQWGKSRSRTSEVLNKLAEEGRLVKFRDGRRIKFRPIEE